MGSVKENLAEALAVFETPDSDGFEELRKQHPVAEALCRRCWWREGHACYNERLMRAGGVNKIPRKVQGDDRNGMEITSALWSACPNTASTIARAIAAQEKGEGE